ncbi:MAG TPA: hypothetical protein VMD91_01200 [Candidatus Sulfotelmatobacter sp.]|nr:hypothetical protein [Candidatus Sulfotelmatobacter sp.]
MQRTIATAALGAALVLAASAQAPSPSAPLIVPLLEQNNSGESGQASLSDTAAGLVVVVTVHGGNAAGPQPNHIHFGTCANLGKVAYPFGPIVNGTSTTTIKGVTIADLQKDQYAINVHLSPTQASTYVACGNIPSK